LWASRCSEISSSNSAISGPDRLAVAEFGLLESQSKSLNEVEVENLDEDVLKVMLDLVVDFKRRLGIDYYVSKEEFKVDLDTIRRWLSELLTSTKKGLGFYGKGEGRVEGS